MHLCKQPKAVQNDCFKVEEEEEEEKDEINQKGVDRQVLFFNPIISYKTNT